MNTDETRFDIVRRVLAKMFDGMESRKMESQTVAPEDERHFKLLQETFKTIFQSHEHFGATLTVVALLCAVDPAACALIAHHASDFRGALKSKTAVSMGRLGEA